MAIAETTLDRTHALIAPGQGNQRVGMGMDLVDRSEAARAVWKMADEVLLPQLGHKLTAVVWQGTEEQLQLTEYAQLAVTTESLARAAAMKDFGQLNSPYYHAGNSVGMIAALVNAGALGVDAAVHLAKGRGEAFRYAIDHGPKTTMMALVGVEEDVITRIREKFVLETCLVNTGNQVVLGGPVENITEASESLKDQGRGKVFLPKVDAAFHSKYMEPAIPLWEQVVNSTPIETPKYGMVVGGSTVTELATPEVIRRELVLQLTHTERYADVIRYLRGQGVIIFTELNGSKRLTNMNMEILLASEEAIKAVVLPRSENAKAVILGYRLTVPLAEAQSAVTEPVQETISRDDVKNWYLTWLSKRQGMNLEDLDEEMLFTDDVGLESEDLKALRAALRSRFGKIVPDEEAAKNVRVSMAIDATYKLVNS